MQDAIVCGLCAMIRASQVDLRHEARSTEVLAFEQKIVIQEDSG